jgi:hypothetical protein
MQKTIKYIFISIILSGIFYAYFNSSHLFIFRVLSFFGLSIFYILTFRYFSIRFKQSNKSIVSSKLISIYVIVLFILLIFSLIIKEVDFVTLFFHPYAFPAFFIAVVALLVNEKSLSILSVISRYMSNLIPLLTILDLLVFDIPILLVASYSFFFFDFLTTCNKKRKYYIILCLLIAIPILNFYDYRSGVIIIFLFLCGLIASNLLNFVRSKFLKFGFLIVSFVVIYFLFFYFTETFEYFTSIIKTDSISSTDSRSFLFTELFSDMKGSDYILGRGYLGTYFSPYFKEWQGEGGDYFQRFSVEVGFLQIILKGGLVLLFSTILVFIKSIYIGFIKFKPNTFKFLISIWLLIEFAMLSIENIPSFGVHFFFIWILIGILNNQSKTAKKLQSNLV